MKKGQLKGVLKKLVEDVSITANYKTCVPAVPVTHVKSLQMTAAVSWFKLLAKYQPKYYFSHQQSHVYKYWNSGDKKAAYFQESEAS